MPTRPVYFDHHSTTPTDPRVVAAMLPYFTAHFGNAASIGHVYGWEASDALDEARGRVAALLGAEPEEVIFTSGATESNNLALKGCLPSLKPRGDHVVCSAIEHRSVLDTLKRLGRSDIKLTLVTPTPDGLVTAEAVAAALSDRTVLVSIIAASNEVGTINPLAEIGQLCHDRGIAFHTDATQAVGKIPIDVRSIGVDLLSLSGHKFHGPKGIGALFVRRQGDRPVRLTPLLDGGSQERGLRSGTVAVPLAVGLGQACALAVQERDDEARRLESLRELLHAGILSRIDGVSLNGSVTARLPNNLNLSFDGVDGAALLMQMRHVAVSAGSACATGLAEPSHVLRAMGVDEARARASLRFGLGRFTTAEEVEFAAAYVASVVARLRSGPGAARTGN